MEEKKLSYNEAMKEVEAILAEIGSEQVDVDTLSEKVERASELLKLCKEKLTKAQEKVDKVLAQ